MHRLRGQQESEDKRYFSWMPDYILNREQVAVNNIPSNLNSVLKEIVKPVTVMQL